MEKSKIKVGVRYAMRGRARGSKYGGDWFSQVEVLQVLPEVKGRYEGWSWERELADQYGAATTLGIVAGKALFLVQYVSKDGDLFQPVGDPDKGRVPTRKVIVSGGCIVSTWQAHRAAIEDRKDHQAKAHADAEARAAKADASKASAEAAVERFNDTLAALDFDRSAKLTAWNVETGEATYVSVGAEALDVLLANAAAGVL
jgi:hypothetical protein